MPDTMPAPNPYGRAYDFSPMAPTNLPDAGVRLNGELDSLDTTITEVIARLALIQRDDGAPKNNTVTLNTLASSLRSLMGGWTPRGTWTTAAAYAVKDAVIGAADGASYLCVTAHTAGTFSTDLAAGKWQKLYGSDATLAGDTGIRSTGSSVDVTLATRFSVQVHVRDFGAVGDGTTDDTTAINLAIAEAESRADASRGGAVVVFEAKNYKVTGTLTITSSFVTLEGQSPQGSRLIFYNMSSTNWISFGDIGGSNIRRGGIRNLGIWGGAGNAITSNANGSTSGAAIKVENAFAMHFDRVAVENVLCGFDIGRTTNDITIANTVIVPNQSGSLYGINWWCPGDGTYRSDVLRVDNVAISCQWTNAIGLNWQGWCNTLIGSGLRILHADKGIRVRNPANSTSYYPNFLNIADLEAEGFKTRAIEITAGAEFKIVNSDINNLSGGPSQGGADDHAIYITPDTGYSYTRGVNIVNSRIGGCRQSGIYSESYDLQLAGVIFYSTSGAGSGSYPVVDLGAATYKATISNMIAESYGGSGLASYGVRVHASANSVVIDGLNATSVVTAAVQDNTSGQVSVSAVWGPSATPYGLWCSPALRTAEVRFAGSGATVESKTYNTGAGASTVARWQLSTGTANSFVLGALQDNSGSPYMIYSGGSAITLQYHDFAQHIFRNASSVPLLTLGTLPTAYADNAAAAAGGVPVGGTYRRTSDNALVYRT